MTATTALRAGATRSTELERFRADFPILANVRPHG